jgi:predicted MFS family arabinose efflux permease
VFGLDASAVSGANAIGPLVGATVAASLGLRAPFIVAAAMLGIGMLTVILWVRDSARCGASADGRPRAFHPPARG